MTTLVRLHAPRCPYQQETPLANALNLIGRKWTLIFASTLRDGPVRFGEIQRRTFASTESTRVTLAAMEEEGLVKKRRFREVPPRVEYELTELGASLLPIIDYISNWGEQHL